MSNITVGMTAFNCLTYSKITIESLLQNCPEDYNLVVVDNGSTDESPFYFEELASDVRAQRRNYTYIRFNKNLGASRAWNEVCYQTKEHGIAVVLNNDICVGKHWLYNLVKPLDDRQDLCHIATSEIIDKAHHSLLHNFFLPLLKKDTYREEIQIELSKFRDEFLRVSENSHIPNIEGGYFPSFAMKKSTFNSIGPFDENFEKTSYEDCDYLVRAKRLGFKPKIIGDSVIFHYGGVTQNFISTHDSNSFQERNKRYFMEKYAVNLDGYVCCRSMFFKDNKLHDELYK
jgi:GT2 family glycosyltransferase